MLGAREPQHRHLSIDPTSVVVCRKLLLMGARFGYLPQSQTTKEIEALSSWEVIKRTEPLVRRALR